MNKIWSFILTLIAVTGVVGTLVGLSSTNPWKVPLIIFCTFLLLFGIVFTILSWIVHPTPWAVLPACKELGIDRICTSGDGGPRMSRRIASAHEIKIMAVTAVSLLHHQKPYFIDALRSGVTIKLLIAALDSPFVQDVEEAESNARVGKISKELEVVEGLLCEFMSEAQLPSGGGRGRIFLGRYSTHLRSSIIVCDDNWGWLTLNLAPKRAMHTCSFVLRPMKEGLITDAIRHFNRIWTIAEKRESIVEISEN